MPKPRALAPLRLLPALLLVAALAPPASALPFGFLGGEDSIIRIQNSVSGSDGCGTGGGPLCAEAVGTLPLADYAEGGHPPVHASASVDPVVGSLKGYVEFVNVAGLNGGTITVASRDFFTVEGPTAGETVSVTVQFALDGFIDVQTNSATADVFASLGVGAGSWDATYGGLASGDASDNTSNGFILNSAGTTIPFDLLASYTFDATAGTAFEVVTSIYAGASAFQAGSVAVDALNTGTLGFVLPDGYTISSTLGYVPEPGSALLLLGGLAALAAARRRRTG